jgi:hypothetical protein
VRYEQWWVLEGRKARQECKTFTACTDSVANRVSVPVGFKEGEITYKGACESSFSSPPSPPCIRNFSPIAFADMDDCSEKLSFLFPLLLLQKTWGRAQLQVQGDLVYIKELPSLCSHQPRLQIAYFYMLLVTNVLLVI